MKARRGFLLKPIVSMKAPPTFLVIMALLILASPSSFAKGQKKPPGVPVKLKEAPAPVQTTLQANAAGGKVRELYKETVNGSVVYLAEVKGTDGKWSKIYVKEAGELIKVEPDNARNKRKHKPLFGD